MENTLSIRGNRKDRKRYSSFKQFNIIEVLHTKGKELKGEEVFMLFIRTEKHEVNLSFSREEIEGLIKYWGV